MPTAKKRPDDITRAPKSAPRKNESGGGRKRGVSAREKVERDNEIIKLRLRRSPWSRIVEITGVPERTCHRVYKEWQDSNLTKIENDDPLVWVLEQLAMLDAMVEQLEEIVLDTDDENTKISALGRKLQAMKRSHELRVGARLIPKELGYLRVQVSMEELVTKVVHVIAKVQDGELPPEEARREVIEVLSPGRRREELEARAKAA